MAGGWSIERIERMKNIPLPNQIKCAGCQAEQPTSNYSETQLARLRKKAAIQGLKAALERQTIRCLNCTGGVSPTEITCNRCYKKKPLEAFTKTQRQRRDDPVCKTCTSFYMTSNTWEEEEEEAEEDNALGLADGSSETASTMPESEGGARLPVPSIFSVASKPPRRFTTNNHAKLGGGIWIEDAASMAPSEADTDSITLAASNAGKFSGWDIAIAREDENRENRENRPPSTNGTEKQRSPWARIKSADPYRNARILKSSDPMRFAADEEDENQEASTRTIAGTKDRSRLHKQIRAEIDESAAKQHIATDGDDASTVKG